MTFSLESLKKTASERLAALEKKSESKQYDNNNENGWKPTVDKEGNGGAILRFLPSPDGHDWVEYWTHGFQGAGGWYIENSRTTLGEDDCVSQMNSRLFKSGIDSDKDIVSKGENATKRKHKVVANILVISDSACPQNEGKVFQWTFGKSILMKIKEALKPVTPDEPKFNPFDLWTGANFRLKIRNKEGQRNYDSSLFDAQTPLFGGDEEKLGAMLPKIAELGPYIDPKNYKPYDELAKKLVKVLGPTIGSGVPVYVKPVELEDVGAVTKSAVVQERPVATSDATVVSTTESGSDDGEDELAAFRRMVGRT